ncbi:hypothetical protein LCGC14_2356160 [marine sediment metagenome]|uniref:Uncharacterized protein n=1 Tax=marine sediment metagenome TaxID=412755 RepID=A0A0F9F2S6_9ZZZZ
MNKDEQRLQDKYTRAYADAYTRLMEKTIMERMTVRLSDLYMPAVLFNILMERITCDWSQEPWSYDHLLCCVLRCGEEDE